MTKLNDLVQAILKSPVLWGILGAIGFYGLVHGGPLATPLIERYFTHHPVEYMETVLFAVGLAALVLKGLDVFGQYVNLSHSPLGAAAGAKWSVEQCPALLSEVERLPAARQGHYYVRRVRAALEHVRDRGSAESLDDELKYLADLDAARMNGGYALFRVIVWAIPILGFLGTVIGITMALNGVRLDAPDQSMVDVLTGLGLKFDTTALALTMSMALMFLHFFVDRAESALLERVDRQAARELAARFPQIPAGPDGQLLAVRRMAETVLQAAERLVERQAELWQGSIEAAAERWTRMADQAAAQLQKGLSGALAEDLKIHAQQLVAAEQSAAERNRQQWERLQQTQTQSVQAVAALQAASGRQAEILQRAIEASGDVVRLEDALNHNLAALAGAKHFEQMFMSLTAAIHLLNARLAETPTGAAPVKLESPRRTAQAA